MQKLQQSDLPYHTCDNIDSQGVDFFLQQGKGRYSCIMVLGESLALDGWVLSGKAFYTASGKLVASGKRFNELFREFGFGIEDVTFTNLCKCVLGKERTLLKKCALKCSGHLLQQIAYCKPRLIIILGKHTAEVFCKMYGVSIKFGELENVVIRGHAYNILSLYHPSPIHPKSMEWNKKIIKKSKIKIRELI